MANVLYKTLDDTQVITLPDPPNPTQPNPDWSSPPPNYPPLTPAQPDKETNDAYHDMVYGWDADNDGYDESVLVCTKAGCRQFIRDQNGNAIEV